MTNEQVIERALTALRHRGTRIGSRSIRCRRYDSVSRRDPRPGWVVAIPLDVPEGLEPDEVLVEVFEPDGEVNIPKIV